MASASVKHGQARHCIHKWDYMRKDPRQLMAVTLLAYAACIIAVKSWLDKAALIQSPPRLKGNCRPGVKSTPLGSGSRFRE